MISHGVKGWFINISSGAVEILRTNGVPYCVSKYKFQYCASTGSIIRIGFLAGPGYRFRPLLALCGPGNPASL